jgi:hypothetical protein
MVLGNLDIYKRKYGENIPTFEQLEWEGNTLIQLICFCLFLPLHVIDNPVFAVRSVSGFFRGYPPLPFKESKSPSFDLTSALNFLKKVVFGEIV